MNNRHLLLLTLSGILTLNSCVNNDYDLSNLDTDNIVIGDEIVAPLGDGVLSLDKMLDIESVKEITVDAAGNYTAAYTDKLNIEIPKDIKLNDIDFSNLNIDIPFSGLPTNQPLPTDKIINLPTKNSPITFSTTDEVKRLDGIAFRTYADNSVLNITLRSTGIVIKKGNPVANFSITFPDKYALIPQEIKYNNTFIDNVLKVDIPVKDLKNDIVLSFGMREVKVSPNDQVSYKSSFSFKKNDIISISTTPQLLINGMCKNLEFEIIYGIFDLEIPTEQAVIDMSDINNIFEGENNVLSFSDPRIKLTANSNFGIPFTAQLDLDAANEKNNVRVTTEINNVNIDASHLPDMFNSNKIWVGANKPADAEGATFIKNTDINSLIKIAPNNIIIDMNAKVAETAAGERQFITANAKANIEYSVEIPFAPAEDFSINITETIEDVFDGDIIEYLFSGGSAIIHGEVLNSIPLNMSMNMVIVGAANEDLGIEMTPQEIKGSANGEATPNEVSFEITEEDMPKMLSAKSINLELKISSDETLAGKMLNKNQNLALKLKIKKTGGIAIDNN